MTPLIQKTLTPLVLFCLLGLVACGGGGEVPPESTGVPVSQRPALDQLSQADAQARKDRIGKVDYTLDIDLVNQADAFGGIAEIRFDLRLAGAPLTVDFTGGTVESVNVNGNEVSPDYNGYFITLPESALLTGANTVTISYRHPYSQDGAGLHRFTDPEDGNTYLYTYLWPYYANRLFPSFDQPNLKASYELSVLAPPGWHVVSTAREDSFSGEGPNQRWHFPRTQPFSTYVFSLHAGPYAVWEDQAGDIPIRLLARQSLAPYVAVEEWLATTQAGLAHYQRYFDIPYPFGKYDQLIVPDFLIGAMENVAAVTFAESYVDRGATSRFNSQRRAQTILHEMAHMWFGDLVTKDWWNGLWLNESFATLMSAIAVAQATEFTDLWHDFYLTENLAAIRADNSAWAHPIEMPVASTNDFFDVFDDITYDKGASVLNQLSHYIGEENFRLGVSAYLKQHAWGNTQLDDFIGALSAQSGIDLGGWADDWLNHAGVNTLSARFACVGGVISRFAILQSAPEEFPTLRSQRVQLGLFGAGADGGIDTLAVIPVVVSDAETPVPEAVGRECPTLVLPNYQGWGYTEIDLDELSMRSLIEDDAMERIDDPQLRSMFWTGLMTASEEGSLDNALLLQRMIDSLAVEANDRVMRQLLGELVNKLNQLERVGATAALSTYGPRAEQQLWSLIAPGTDGSTQSASTLTLRFDNFVNLARSDAALARLENLLLGELEVPGLQLGQNQRWSIIRRFSQRDYPAARQWLAQESLQDASDAGRLAAIAAEAALPAEDLKRQWVGRILAVENPLPLSHLRAAMANLFPPGQEALQLALMPELLADLPALASGRDNYYLQSYGSDLFAGVCDTDGARLLNDAVADRAAIGATLYKFLSENARRASRCVEQFR